MTKKTAEELWAESTLKRHGAIGASDILGSLKGQLSDPRNFSQRVFAKKEALSKALAMHDATSKASKKDTPKAPAESPADFNYRLCKKYMNLKQSADSRGKSFALSISDVRRLLKVKKCQYTGVTMTEASDLNPISTDRTIDRLDHNKGYIPGNVFAVCHVANKAKNDILENSETKVNIDFAITLLSNIKARGFK